MHKSIYALLAATALIGAAPTAQASPAGSPAALRGAIDRIDMSELAAVYVYGGHLYWFFFVGWSGPGWYWCGYRHRRGVGFGGAYGFHGWHDRGFEARRGGGAHVFRGGGARHGVEGGRGAIEGGRAGGGSGIAPAGSSAPAGGGGGRGGKGGGAAAAALRAAAVVRQAAARQVAAALDAAAAVVAVARTVVAAAVAVRTAAAAVAPAAAAVAPATDRSTPDTLDDAGLAPASFVRPFMGVVGRNSAAYCAVLPRSAHVPSTVARLALACFGNGKFGKWGCVNGAIRFAIAPYGSRAASPRPTPPIPASP